MLDRDILQKAIEKAVKNGYGGFDSVPDKVIKVTKDSNGYLVSCYWNESPHNDFFGAEDKFYFSHGFAKAFWGEEHDWEQVTTFNTECKKCGMVGESGWSVVDKCWESALKQMVLEENPIKYLERFI